MPLLWRIPDDYPQEQIGRYDRDRGPDRFVFLKGCRLSEPFEIRPKIQFDCKKDDLCRNDCIWPDALVPIVNDRMRDFLNSRVSDQVQFFDVDISANDGNVYGYYILNLTNVFDVIDIDSSKYNFIPGTKKVMSFSSLRVYDSGIDDIGVGRDKIYLSYLFVGSGLAKDLKIAEFRGVSLIEPSSVI
ncbi:imm11 family protein [Sphingopyxis sp.]|uniref:imm11 family protein n=1 Tax=Sphingopyxis sp. TaxID=1908224 RepID=UPI002FCC6828